MFDLLLAFAMLGAGSTSAPVSLQVKVLEPAAHYSLDMPTFSYWSDAQCDAEANLYFHIGADFRMAKILRLSPKGQDADILAPSRDLSDMEKFGFLGFFVTRAGEPYMLGSDGKKSYVIRFAEDGSTKTPVLLELPAGVSATGFAVFETGAFLVAGHYSGDAPVAQRAKDYLAVFEPSGSLRKELRGVLSDQNAMDKKMDKKAESHPSEAPDDETRVASSDDGKLYVLAQDGVHVISASGEPEGTIRFRKPDPKSVATRVYVSGNLVAIKLSLFDADGVETQRRYLVLDRNNHDQPFGYYQPSEEIDSTDVCFSRDQGFTFQKFQNGRQTLFVAPLR
jgi:hypothetical protein